MASVAIRITSLLMSPQCLVNMLFSDEDNILYQLNGYKATELTNEFPNKWWPKSNINRQLKKLRDDLHLYLTLIDALNCSVAGFVCMVC